MNEQAPSNSLLSRLHQALHIAMKHYRCDRDCGSSYVASDGSRGCGCGKVQDRFRISALFTDDEWKSIHAGGAPDEPPDVRRWDIRPAFADGVDFLVDPAGEWVKWEDVAPHLRTTQPPGAWRSALIDKPTEADGPVVLVFTGEAYSVEYPTDVNGVEHVAWRRITPYTRFPTKVVTP